MLSDRFGPKADGAYYKSKVDSDGYYKMQLSNFVDAFKDTMFWGKLPFDTDILIESNDLREIGE